MKLHYTKMFFFYYPLNILVSSSYEQNNNKQYIKSHTSTTISRVLSEYDLYMPKYDNDADMKSVKEKFDRQTSQRFEENEERMNRKRQKCKEQCDKDIQEIILKDKIEKSLEEKVEKVCLICGCGLGGVAASVGIIGSLAVNELKKAALLVAVQKGIDAGIKAAIKGLGEIYVLSDFKLIDWAAKINGTNFLKPNDLIRIVSEVYYKCIDSNNGSDFLFCQAMGGLREQNSTLPLETISREAAKAAGAAGEASKAVEKAQITLANAESTHLYSAIGYSVTAILIIVLIMIIIYLILRYRRKKKMNKKLQYTKLLNK
ncbi:PIR protein, putative [Plasmodium sp. gorilla clade G1]|nr:PIR protein, putative [Plasmodium sp. gorilla clade G1]